MKAYEVRLSREAQRDIQGIHDYIAQELQNPQAAVTQLRRLHKAVLSLASMPERGTPLKALLQLPLPHRCLVCGTYRLFYLIEQDTVTIIRVLNERQDYLFRIL